MPELSVVILSSDSEQRAVLQVLVDGTSVARTALAVANFPVAGTDPIVRRIQASGAEVLLVDSPLTGLDLKHANWWLSFLTELWKGHAVNSGHPVTLIVSTADLRPWQRRAGQFAVLKDKRLAVIGRRDQLETASVELVQELLAREEQVD